MDAGTILPAAQLESSHPRAVERSTAKGFRFCRMAKQARRRDAAYCKALIPTEIRATNFPAPGSYMPRDAGSRFLGRSRLTIKRLKPLRHCHEDFPYSFLSPDRDFCRPVDGGPAARANSSGY